MARKNLLDGLTSAELPAGNFAPVNAAARGAIGAVSRSIEQIRAQSVMELSPDLIDASFIEDRLGVSEPDQTSLTESIKAHGQQAPILVRPHPSAVGRYQIAYGRRRLRAAATLNIPVRAIVKPLSDEQLVVAQGQENNERRDLSFIERALFASALEDRGFGRETIMAAMSVDKTGLSRLISSAVRIPRDILHAIGPAPKTGRDRWGELAAALDRSGAPDKARKAIGQDDFAAKTSDERFASVLRAASVKSRPRVRATTLRTAEGLLIAKLREDSKTLQLTVDRKSEGEFAAYLVDELPNLYARFYKRV